jgi:GTP-binding protein
VDGAIEPFLVRLGGQGADETQGAIAATFRGPALPVTHGPAIVPAVNTSTAVFIRSAPDLDSCPEGDRPEFAFAGRSNVGKSSLLNLLVGKRDLARVSATPGHTKQLNFFDINRRWRLVDMPGYGFAKVGRAEKTNFTEAISRFLVDRENLVLVFTLVDSSLPPQRIDLEFVEFLVNHEVPFVLVFTKTDKCSPTQVQTHIEQFKEAMLAWTANLPIILTCSAYERKGRNALLKIIEEALEPEQKRPQVARTPAKRNTPW